MKQCQYCGKMIDEKLMFCPYCMKDPNIPKKISRFKKDYLFIIFSFIFLISLFFPLIEFNYYPNGNYTFEMFINNDIEMIHRLNIFRLIFGFNTGYDRIKFNAINILLIIFPILITIFRKKKFSIIFIIGSFIVLLCTRFLFLGEGMTTIKEGFSYEIIYSYGFFASFILLTILLIIYVIYWLGGKKDGHDM